MKNRKQGRVQKKGYARLTAVGMLTILLFIFIWSVYPGYIFHDLYLSRTISNGCAATEVLSDAVSVKQYFKPQLSWLGSIQIAAEFDTEAVKGETLFFSLCEESGKVIFSCEVVPEEMESGMYYDIAVRKKLNTETVYYWCLTSPESADCKWQLMYTEYVENQAPENLLFLVGDDGYGSENAQTVSQYTYYIHFDKAVTVAGYWISGILIYIICLEIVDRIFIRLKR